MSADVVVAITLAPSVRQSWIDAMPIELDAAGTTTQSPGPTPAISTSAPHAVRYCIQIAPASRSSIVLGVRTTTAAGTVIDSAAAPSWTTSKDEGRTPTRSPTANGAPGPTASTIPAPSKPLRLSPGVRIKYLPAR